ncbi:MAG: DEAD/DEAH box helicase family protein, partial [Actinomycetota bacterium]
MTTLPELLTEHGEAITRAVLRAYPPVYTARTRDDWGFDLTKLKRRPMGAQGDAIRAAAVSLQRHRGTNVVGEMGTGKTMIGASAAYVAGFRRVLVLCPPHLTRKWVREVQETVPLAEAVIVNTISDLRRLRLDHRWPLFVILSREKAKLSYR